MDAAEFVVGEVDGPGEEPEQGESEKTGGEAFTGVVVCAAAREKDGGDGGAGSTEGGDVFTAVWADAEKLRGDPDEPGEREGEDEIEPDLALHLGREISLKSVGGNHRDEMKPLDAATRQPNTSLRAGLYGNEQTIISAFF